MTWGQNVCRPVYPSVPQCVLVDVCPKIGVTKVGKLVNGHDGAHRTMLKSLSVATCRRLAIALSLPHRGAAEVAWRRPVIVLETAKGTIEFETYPEEAPKTVARIVELVKKNFYNGLAVPSRRAELRRSSSAIRRSRDMSREDWWGRGGQRQADRRRRRSRRSGGTCAARWRWRYPGNASGAPTASSSSLRRAAPELDGKYTVFGQVIKGHGRRRQDSERRRAQDERT